MDKTKAQNGSGRLATELAKPTIANGGIVAPKSDQAKSEILVAKSELNDLKRETAFAIGGVPTAQKVAEAEMKLREVLGKHGINLTDDGLSLICRASRSGFDQLGLKEGYDYVATPDQLAQIQASLEEYAQFHKSAEGQEEAQAIMADHTEFGTCVQMKHSISSGGNGINLTSSSRWTTPINRAKKATRILGNRINGVPELVDSTAKTIESTGSNS